LQGEYVRATVQVYSRDGTESVVDNRDLRADRYASDAREFARDLAERGADDLIAQARREDDEQEAKRGEE
jgi:hydroxymethylbilane synthase